MTSQQRLPHGTPTCGSNERTNVRTNGHLPSPPEDISPSVTRTRTYGGPSMLSSESAARTARDRLRGLPKEALIELALRLGAERNLAVAERDRIRGIAGRWRQRFVSTEPAYDWSAAEVRARAELLLETLPVDPNARWHLDELAIAVGDRSHFSRIDGAA